MKPHKTPLTFGRFGAKARFLTPLLMFAFGMAVPVALGAARTEKALPGTYAKIGLDSRFPNMLVCQHKGDLLLLTYEESAVPIRHGMVTFTGTIQTTPLRDALREYMKSQGKEEAGSGETPPPAASGSKNSKGK
jgi:hypothetical protein